MDEFGCGGSASLDMRIKDFLMSGSTLAFSGLILQAIDTEIGTKMGSNMLFICSGLYHNKRKGGYFRIVQLCTLKITVSGLTSAIFLSSLWNAVGTFIALRSRTISIMEVLPH